MAPPSISPDRRVEPPLLRRWISAYSGSTNAPHEDDRSAFDLQTTRSDSDAVAAWHKWHHGLAVSWFDQAQMPWYLALEHARVECQAGADLPGIASNLRALGPQGWNIAPEASRLYRFARVSWGLDFHESPAVLTKEPLPDVSKGRGLLRSLRHLIGIESYEEPESRWLRETLGAAGRFLDDEKSFARAVYPLVCRMGGSAASTKQNDERCQQDAHQTNAADDEHATEPEEEVGYGPEQAPECHSKVGQYAIFRTAWDQCLPARVWHQSEDTEALKGLNALNRRKVRKLAHELQRHLLAKRMRRWNFELEEGMLDSRKLASLVGDQPDHRVFKCETESQVPEACVTLLVDQSGSMRGAAHLLAAQALDVAVHTLEVCGVAVEVLGYTTSHGADNPVVDVWREGGSPDQPGRLNALRHIVFKDAGQPWRFARRHLGLLLRPGFGRENIDGESVLWAARRLLARREQRKVLMVLSDGSPYDEATVQNNASGILENHLRDVTGAVQRSPINLIGIGTGREVSRFYQNAVTVRQEEKIGDVLFGALGDCLD